MLPHKGDEASDPRAWSWAKVKVRHEGVFVVGGFRNVDAFDGILVGEYVDDALQFRGVVEWGYRAHDVVEILREAEMFTRGTSPFVDLPRLRHAVWLEPRLRAEISYAELVGGKLRAPSWRGLRGLKRALESIDLAG